MPELKNNFTAAQIAAALGMKRQAVQWSLRGVRPAAAQIVAGNEAAAWTVEQLPPTLRGRLEDAARQQRCRTVAALLSMPRQQWQPDIPLDKISDKDIQIATKLREALKPWLIQQHDLNLSSGEIELRGVEDYRRAFGNRISTRYWRELFMRTIRRDNGAEEWNRLEVYLPDRLKQKVTPAAVMSEALAADFAELESFIVSCSNPHAPNKTECAGVWTLALEKFTSLVNAGEPEKFAARRVRQFLFARASFLAVSRGALWIAFKRKMAALKNPDGIANALRDGRVLRRGVPTAPNFPQDDIDKIIWHAAHGCGGRVAQSVRELAEKNDQSGLSENTLSIITRPTVNKSYVNTRLAKVVRHEVKMIKPYLLGQKAIDDATAHVERDYSKLSSMQVVGADDFTLPVYFYIPDGKGWFTASRGQCLVFLDSRSMKILAWSLQPERNYNSMVIRTLQNHVCAQFGLPKQWYFEFGIWEGSHLVKGSIPAGWKLAPSMSECATIWEQLGVDFVHATRARSKPVERVGRALQDLMEGVRGYCGRDERRDCPAVTTKAKQHLQFKRVNHPGELFLSFDEWEAELGMIIERFNGAKQNGKILRGLSPDEAFEKHWPQNNPPTRLDASCWHLLAHYFKPVSVTKNGICFQIGHKKFIYRNERTGQDRGKTVLAWFDPECPEIICVTDLNRKNPYLVEQASDVDFMAEPGDPVLQRELARAASHSAYPKARFHVLKTKFAPLFRRNLVGLETAETAAFISEGREIIKDRQNQRQRQRSQANRIAQSTGLDLSPDGVGKLTPEHIQTLRDTMNSEDIL
jgi:hypothetical protein